MMRQGLLGSTSKGEWMMLTASISALILLDFLLLRRLEGLSGHLMMVFFWVGIAMIYCGHYCLEFGTSAGADWFLGYLLEVVLSIDNVFVFHLVFSSFRPPLEQQHKAMYLGVIGALVARLFLFLALGTVVHTVRWVRLLMGFLLIYSGIKATMDDEGEEEDDPADNIVVRAVSSCLGSRLLTTYDNEGRIFYCDENGRLHATMLLPLIFCVEAVDVIFAMDSLSAKVAQIKNPYAAYSSSAFAILMLRALFFLLRDMVDYFTHLKYGLCIILVFIGMELLAADFVELPSSALCLAISAVFLISVLSSIRAKWTEEAIRSGSRRGSRASSRRSSRASRERSSSRGSQRSESNESLDEGGHARERQEARAAKDDAHEGRDQ
jgi:tellurite resistance protein TerC